MTKKPNIILITIDALRADHLGFMGYQKNVSPNIDALSQESTVFTQAFATGPNTPQSFPAILTSTYPLDYQGSSQIAKPRVLISQVLQEQGYTTAIFHSSAYLANFFGYNQGWDFFEDTYPYSANKKPIFFKKTKFYFLRFFLIGLFAKLTFNLYPHLFFTTRYLKSKIQASNVVKPVVQAEFINKMIQDFICTMADQKKPFFLSVHYMDVHSYLPYDCHCQERPLTYSEWVARESVPTIAEFALPFNPLVKKFTSQQLDRCVDLYDQGIKYIDQKIEELLGFLKEKNLYQNSIICLAADHGDEFLEHGGSGHTMDDNRLYNELLWVPFLIRSPAGKKQTIKYKVSLIDLAPTLCDLAGINPPAAFKGNNLFYQKRDFIFHQIGLPRKEDNLAEVKKRNQCAFSCQDAEWKYILSCAQDKEELYNLTKDPFEQKNLALEQPEVLDRLRKIIKQFEEENPPLSLVEI